jgi:exodeoxyribonuclease V alpha subunit
MIANEQQREAVELSLRVRMMVLTGGPGTGKTATIRLIGEAHGWENVALAAPTGKAARRLKESTGRDAQTLHRLLEFSPYSGEFQRNQHRTLESEVVIVDEASMVDLRMMAALLRALDPVHGRLILVGDGNQLPPVGPGSVIADLIQSGKVPSVCLTQIHRQAAESLIVRNAHHILHREGLEVCTAPGGDFYWIECPTVSYCAQKLTQIVLEEIPQARNIDPIRGIQVLLPQRPGPLGVDAINQSLGALLNPTENDSIRIGDRTFRRGDKVMQTSNNYRLQVSNGEWGIVQQLDSGRGLEVLLEDGREIYYTTEDATSLIHSYAITIHRAQGSEYDAVVIPLSMAHANMLSRPLLYTAVTRGKKLVVLMGERVALRKAMTSNGTSTRRTSLADRLQGME